MNIIKDITDMRKTAVQTGSFIQEGQKVDLSLSGEEFERCYGRKKILSTLTLGCKVNQYETEAMEELFLADNYSLTSFENPADVYVINTCTVTAMSDKKSRQMIRRTKRLNPDSIVVVTGCYSQSAPQEVLAIEEVNLVMGTTKRNDIVKEVQRTTRDDKRVVVDDIMKLKDFEEMSISSAGDHTRAFVKIQDGCDRFCTYCIIPYTRGRVRSRNLDGIVREVTSLVKNGYREVVLTGIHVASYGKDLQEGRLIDVIETLSKMEGLDRIRISSVEPTVITDEFLDRISRISKFCPHFHLSLQSGCNSVLKRMNRRYSVEEYREAVSKIRRTYLFPAITTDVIVGFPGETREEFRQTENFLREIKLFEMHVFPYSPREGTVAAKMKDAVSKEEKQRRSKALMELDARNRAEFMRSQIGYEAEVLFETKEGNYRYGHTMNYMKVRVKSEKELSNGIYSVRLLSLQGDILEGEIISFDEVI